jgi:hypothetical protein
MRHLLQARNVIMGKTPGDSAVQEHLDSIAVIFWYTLAEVLQHKGASKSQVKR